MRFVRRIFDVTSEVMGNVPSIAGQKEYEEITRANIAALTERLEKEHPGMRIEVKPFFEGNQFFAFVMEVYSDVRLAGHAPVVDRQVRRRHRQLDVAAPYGRFRCSASTPDLITVRRSIRRKIAPTRPKKYLKISLGGVRENDFAMIMGFPGSTQRFATSYELGDMLAVSNPQRIFIRGERQEILWKDMLASDAVRIQYASKYARSSNYWKNSIGMSRGIEKLKVKERKEEQEESFRRVGRGQHAARGGVYECPAKVEEAVAARSEGRRRAAVPLRGLPLNGIELIQPALAS